MLIFKEEDYVGGKMKILERAAIYIVKGTSITFNEKIKVNEETGEEIYDPKLEQENDVKLYNEYRKLNSLLLPEEIKSIREKYGKKLAKNV